MHFTVSKEKDFGDSNRAGVHQGAPAGWAVPPLSRVRALIGWGKTFHLLFGLGSGFGH